LKLLISRDCNLPRTVRVDDLLAFPKINIEYGAWRVQIRLEKASTCFGVLKLFGQRNDPGLSAYLIDRNQPRLDLLDTFAKLVESCRFHEKLKGRFELSRVVFVLGSRHGDNSESGGLA
jgi:hypothetical protein